MNTSTNSVARAVRESAAFFDLSGWSSLYLFGSDANAFLHNFCTADIKGLPPGRACEAFITNEKARVLGHGFVISWPEFVNRCEENLKFLKDGVLEEAELVCEPSLTLIGPLGQNNKLKTHLDRYLIREQVTIDDERGLSWTAYVCGPDAAAMIESMLPDSYVPVELKIPTQLAPGETTCVFFQNVNNDITRLDLFGRPGFLIEWTFPAFKIEDLVAGGFVEGTAEQFEALRIEACFPYYGVDITEDHLAPEVGRPWAISYTKGCYLGQEPIARIDALGHVNKLLRGVRLESGPVPERGAAIIAEGKEIGSVTSATISLADDRPVALAYLRSKFAEPGTSVAVRTHDGDVPATVFGPP